MSGAERAAESAPPRPLPSASYAFALGHQDAYAGRWATAPTRAAILLRHPELTGSESLWRLCREGWIEATAR